MIVGKNIEIGVSVEQSRGVPQAGAEKWVKKMTANIRPKAMSVNDDISTGSLEDSDNSRIVKKWIEGDVDGILHVDAIGYFIYNLYGSVSSSWVASGVYSHVFTLLNSVQHPSLAIFGKDGAIQQKVFNNCMVNSLEINAVVEDFVKFKMSMIGKVEASNADTPSYDTEYDFIGKDVSVKVADTEAGLVGATALEARNLNIKFDAALLADHILGSYFPDDVYNTTMKIEGDMEITFADTTFKDMYLGDTAKYMQITITGSQNIGSSNYPTITILLNKVKITNHEISGGRDEIVTEKITFKAFRNTTDNQQSKITIKNNTPEYAVAPSA